MHFTAGLAHHILGIALESNISTHWGTFRVTLGLYWDNGKENGNYYIVQQRVLQLSCLLIMCVWFNVWQWVSHFGHVGHWVFKLREHHRAKLCAGHLSSVFWWLNLVR